MLIDEIGKFAVAEAGRSNIGTRFILQAMTWLNQQRWADHAAIAALAELTEGRPDRAGGADVREAGSLVAACRPGARDDWLSRVAGIVGAAWTERRRTQA